MMQNGHLDTDLLVRAIDDELNESEHKVVGAHLASCEVCRTQFDAFRMLSVDVDTVFIAAASVAPTVNDRAVLEKQLEHCESLASGSHRKHRYAGRIAAWGLAAAAALAAVALFLMRPDLSKTARTQSASLYSSSPATLDIEGETFVSLPYSNTDLPVSPPRIVRMQVPVASLLDAGVVFEPVSNAAASMDRSVLADVLLGLDGEPLGVHVIGFE